MQFKLVPRAPEDLEYVETVRRAVPLVPGDEDDCCARIMQRTDVSPRDEARTWLTFLRALELAREGPSGFSRTHRDFDVEHLRTAFRERLYGVECLLDILDEAEGETGTETKIDGENALSSEAVFDRFRAEIPQYEQYRFGDRLEEVWGERVSRLLEWAVLLNLAERTEDGYVAR